MGQTRYNKYNNSKKGKDARKRYRAKKNKYSEFIYSLDIETSTTTGVDYNGQSKPCSFMYSCAVSKLNIKTHEIEHVAFFRTYNEVSDFLTELDDLKQKTLFYIHNFSYEWDFFNRNVPFFAKRCKKQLYAKNHKPLEIKSKYLHFRCSYLLTGIGVEKMGIKLTNKTGEDWKKLDYDYKEIRTPLTDLTTDEIAYNFRDVDIVLKYIDLYFLDKYSVKTIMSRIYTITSTARFLCKDINSHFNWMQWVDFNNDCAATSEKQLFLWYECFLGGLVTSNPNYFMKITKDVASFDFASSYPYVMRFKKFPYKFREQFVDINEFKEIVKDPAINKTRYFNVIIKIANLQLNQLKYPILSEHKILKQSNKINVINGKIINAELFITSMTSTDYELLCNFYNFDLLEVLYYEENEELKMLPKYILNSIDYLLTKKSEFKAYLSEIEDAEEYRTDYKFNDKAFAAEINSLKTYSEQLHYADDEYNRIKALLNSLYGVNVQKPLNDNVSFNYDTFEYVGDMDTFDDYESIKYHKTNLCIGCYICAFARYNLGRLLISFLKNKVPVLYTDTDSIKCVYNAATKPVIDKIVNAYNKHVQNDKNIGQFEYEHGKNYDLFVTNGNKSYISVTNNIIKATISGMPAASDIYTSFYEYYGQNFHEMIKNCYTFNTVIDYSVVKKLTHKYSDMFDEFEELDKNIIHIVIDNYDDYVYTGMILEDCNLSIRYIEESPTQLVNACNLIKFFGADINEFTTLNTICTKNKKLVIESQSIDEKYIKLLERRAIR